MRSNQHHENLHIMVVKKMVDRETNTFRKFIARLTDEINKGIAQLDNDYLQQPSEIKNKLLIVSHEYLYGYDHEADYYGLTRDEKKEFKKILSEMVIEISQKYNIDVMLAPGTVVWKKEGKERGEEVQTRNTAYFFSSKGGVGKHHKEQEGRREQSDTIKWEGENTENILTTICCENRNFYPMRRIHSIQFIPSAGMNLFPKRRDGTPADSTVGHLSPTPGITFISVDKGYPTYIRQTTVASAEKCASPVQNADPLLKEPLVKEVNDHTSIYSFPFDQKSYDEIVKYQTDSVIKEISFLSEERTEMDPTEEEVSLLLRVLKGETSLDALEPYLNGFLDNNKPAFQMLAFRGPHLPLTKWIDEARSKVSSEQVNTNTSSYSGPK